MSWIEGEDYYQDADGLVTLTAKYLRERGFCCGKGCLHCPYDYIRVPEPTRTYLLNERATKTGDAPS
jgi:hypothetical protein